MNSEQKSTLNALTKDVEVVLYMSPDGTLGMLNDAESKVALALGLKKSDLRRKMERFLKESAETWVDMADPVEATELVVKSLLPEVVMDRLAAPRISALIEEVITRRVEEAVAARVEEILAGHKISAKIVVKKA